MFMKNLKVLSGVAAVLVALSLCVPAVAADRVTVGDFVTEIAKVKGLPAANAVEAQTSLSAAGVRLQGLDLNAVLTQGDVVTIGNAAGLNLSSSTPEAEFGSDDVSSFMVNFAPELGSSPENGTTGADNNGNGADPLTKGKGLKKGLLKRSPSEPI